MIDLVVGAPASLEVVFGPDTVRHTSEGSHEATLSVSTSCAPNKRTNK